jgi:hypothetical protein
VAPAHRSYTVLILGLETGYVSDLDGDVILVLVSASAVLAVYFADLLMENVF